MRDIFQRFNNKFAKRSKTSTENLRLRHLIHVDFYFLNETAVNKVIEIIKGLTSKVGRKENE